MRCRTGCLILAVWAFTALSVAQEAPAYKRGVQLFNDGKYSEALDAFTQAIAANPGDSNAYRQRAKCRQRLDDLKGALTDFDEAVKLDPQNARTLSDRSALRRRLKDPAGALEDINRAIEIDPAYAGAYNNRGLLRWDAADYKGALADYDRSAELDPRQNPVFNNRGLVKEKLNDLQGAIADYTKAIDNNPKNADAYSNRAFCHRKAGSLDRARRDYESALAINPGHKFATDQLEKLKTETVEQRAPAKPLDTLPQKPAANSPPATTAVKTGGFTPTTFGDFVLEVPPGWERAPSEIEKNDKTWQMADVSRNPNDPLIVAFPFENFPFSSEQKRLEFLATFKENVRKAHRATLVSEKVSLAGVEFERLRFKDKDGRTTFYLTPYNGAKVYPIYVFRPDAQEAFPERALDLLSSLRLVGPKYSPETKQNTASPPSVAETASGSSPAIPVVKFQADDPCKASAKAPTGVPWQKAAGVVPPPAPAGFPPATLPPFLDAKKMSAVQYNGEVSFAVEGMRLLYGEMAAEDHQKFQRVWAPMFDYPTPDAVDYLNKLNPLLGQFLAGREAFLRAAGGVQAAMYQAATAVAADSRDAYFGALTTAARHQQVLRSLEAGLNQVAAQIQALGNPPNPLAAKCTAQERYRRALPATPSLLDGEWVTDAGARWYFKTVKRYPEGMLLLYQYSFAYAAKLSKEGIDTAKPGIENTENGMIMVAGMEDVLRLMEEQPGGMLFSAPVELGITLDGYFPDGERFHFVRYATGLGEEFVFSGNTLYRAIPTCTAPPVLPGHTWEGILEVARKYEAGRIEGLRKAKRNFPTQVQALMNCDPDNLPPPPPKKRNPWDEGPYKADDPRSKLPPAEPASAPQAPKAPAKPPTQSAESITRQETIDFHQSMIKLLNGNLQKEQEELNLEPDQKRKQQLAFRVIQLQSDIQAEQDLIASCQTGEIVHTRSAFDEFASNQFLHKIREEAARVDATRRIDAAIDEYIESAPEEVKASLREKKNAILDPKSLAGGDVEKAAKLAESIGTMIQGYHEGKAAKQEEKAIDKAEMQFYFSTFMMTSGVTIIGLSSAALAAAYGETAAVTVWGPHIVGGIYGGAHGLAAGGPVEGVTQAIAWSSPLGFMATQFAEGITHAGNDPKSTWQDAVWSGVKQAGTAFVLGKAMEFGAGFTAKGALSLFGENSVLFKPLVGPSRNVKLAFEAAKTEQDVADALSLIKYFNEKQAGMAKMRSQLPAGSPQLAQAEKELSQLAASLNSSYHCKSLLKYHSDPSVSRAFASLVDKSYEETIPEMLRILKAQGYDVSKLRFKPTRNASSAGSSSMDLDLALEETPGLLFSKNGKAVSIEQLQKDGQKALSEAYHNVTGFSATRSEINFTTSVHSESYATKELLNKNVDFGKLTPEEVASIGKVLEVKVTKIQGDPVLSQIAKIQGQCREGAKEIENMLLNDLQQKLAKAPAGSREAQQAQADINYWTEMLKNFKQMSMQETNPYRVMELDRMIRTQTGGKGVQEVLRDLSQAFRR